MIFEKGIDLALTSEACPQQFQGEVDGNPAYFRLRHGGWRFTIVESGGDAVSPGDFPEKGILFWAEGACKVGDGCMQDVDRLITSLVQAFRTTQREKCRDGS